MANTFEIIDKVTVGSGGAASITFSSIPSTYTDLLLMISARATNTSMLITLNSSGTGFTVKAIEGDGASAYSFNQTRFSGNTSPSGSTANTFNNVQMYFPNYTSSNYKSYSIDSVSENNGTTAYTDLIAGLWSDTSAITSLTLSAQSGTFSEYSSFYLYGIKNS
jgi:hypothetical protein